MQNKGPNGTITVRFLGTGTSQGVPVIGCPCKVCQSMDSLDKRLRTSILVEQYNHAIAIDAGPDFRQQMLREDVNRLSAVVITHNHKDHTAGLDDVRAFNWIQKKPMDIFARPSVLKSIQQEFPYAFGENKYPGAPDINIHTIENHPFHVDQVAFTPIEAMHHQMPVYGFRIGDFTYLTDANRIAPEEIDKIMGSRIVVLGALRKEKHISHFTLDEAVEMMRILNPEKGYLTHISHQMGLHRQVQAELPPNIFLAYDGLQITL